METQKFVRMTWINLSKLSPSPDFLFFCMFQSQLDDKLEGWIHIVWLLKFVAVTWVCSMSMHQKASENGQSLHIFLQICFGFKSRISCWKECRMLMFLLLGFRLRVAMIWCIKVYCNKLEALGLLQQRVQILSFSVDCWSFGLLKMLDLFALPLWCRVHVGEFSGKVHQC